MPVGDRSKTLSTDNCPASYAYKCNDLMLQLGRVVSMMQTASYPTSGLLVWHVARSLLTIDPDLATRLGLSVESGRHECRAEAFVARIHPDDRDRTLEEGNLSFESGAPFSTRYRIYDRTDDIVTVLATGWWVYDEAQQPSSMMTHLLLNPEASLELANAYEEAGRLLHHLHRLTIQQGWRDMQYFSSIMQAQLGSMVRNNTP